MGTSYVFSVKAYLILFFSVCVLSLFSHAQLFETQWTVACQAPLSMGFSRQEYWSGLPCPSSGDLPKMGIEPMCFECLELAGRLFTTSATWKALYTEYIMQNAGLDRSQLESKLLGEISITSNMQIIPPKWQKAKRN